MSKAVRVLGHPLHAILSDFPLALFGTSLLWDLIGIFRGEAVWWAISFWDIALGVLVALVAATIGAVDYSNLEQENPAQGTAIRHLLFMLATVGLYTASLFVRAAPSAPVGTQRIIVLVLESLGLILLSVGGWYGGHLVFHYGIGRDDS